jgi:hypothetical protein
MTAVQQRRALLVVRDSLDAALAMLPAPEIAAVRSAVDELYGRLAGDELLTETQQWEVLARLTDARDTLGKLHGALSTAIERIQ